MVRILSRPALLLGAAILLPPLLAGCTQQTETPAVSTAAPPAAPAAPPPAPMDPMASARSDVAMLETAIQSQNKADALAALDRLQADVPKVSMRADTMGRITAGITRTRRDVNNGAWASAQREVTTTRNNLQTAGGGGAG